MGSFTRDEWNYLLSSVPSIVLLRSRKEHKKMQVKKESQQSQSRWWISVSRYRVRDPNVLASTASESPRKTKSRSPNVPLSSLNVQQTSTVRPVLGASSSGYSEWNFDEKWSSQVWKSGEMSNTSTERLENDKIVIDDDMDWHRHRIEPFSKITIIHEQSECSIACWTVLQKISNSISSNILWFGECLCLRQWKRLFSWKNYSDNLHASKNTVDYITMKQMFEISEQLILGQSDEIVGVSQISWENSPWRHLSVVTDEQVISHSHAKVMYFQNLWFVLERWIRTQHQILFEENSWVGSKIHHNTEFVTQLTENRWNSIGIFSQDSLIVVRPRSPKVHEKWANENNSEDELSSCRSSMTSYGVLKTMNMNVLLISSLLSLYAKRFPAGRWSFLGSGWDTKWCSTNSERPQG